MNKASDQRPLSARIDRLSIEGRIAWHADQAALDRLAHRVEIAREAVRAADAAARGRMAA